jgi:predicted GNAT superfamily acetyltransferase
VYSFIYYNEVYFESFSQLKRKKVIERDRGRGLDRRKGEAREIEKERERECVCEVSSRAREKVLDIITFLSSSSVHGPLMIPGLRTFCQRCRH